MYLMSLCVIPFSVQGLSQEKDTLTELENENNKLLEEVE